MKIYINRKIAYHIEFIDLNEPKLFMDTKGVQWIWNTRDVTVYAHNFNEAMDKARELVRPGEDVWFVSVESKRRKRK